MKKVVISAIALGLGASSTWATDINISVTSGGNNQVTVTPGETVDYVVAGQLSDGVNEGLALIGFDLAFDGGDLTAGTVPDATMQNFVRNAGIDNPAGYGGTIINGDIIQAGGGQNTIKNFAQNAEFPVGTVITGVAKGQTQNFLDGSLTAPNTAGTYTLALQNVFANVIKQGETGQVFWATEAAGVGNVGNLTVIVEAGDPCDGADGTGVKVGSAKCKIKNGAVKKVTVKGKNALPNTEYTCDLQTGQSQTKTSKANGALKFSFGNEVPCGPNAATLCGNTKTFDCGC